jgi:hypothetical protein
MQWLNKEKNNSHNEIGSLKKYSRCLFQLSGNVTELGIVLTLGTLWWWRCVKLLQTLY